MAKKATPTKKSTKKVDYQAATEGALLGIQTELSSAIEEFNRFKDKGVKACLGRVRKHLMIIKRAASDGRKHVQEVRNALK